MSLIVSFFMSVIFCLFRPFSLFSLFGLFSPLSPFSLFEPFRLFRLLGLFGPFGPFSLFRPLRPFGLFRPFFLYTCKVISFLAHSKFFTLDSMTNIVQYQIFLQIMRKILYLCFREVKKSYKGDFLGDDFFLGF